MAFVFNNIEQQLQGGSQPNIFGGGAPGMGGQEQPGGAGGTGSLAKSSTEGSLSGGQGGGGDTSQQMNSQGSQQNASLLKGSQEFKGAETLAPVKQAAGAVKGIESSLQEDANKIGGQSFSNQGLGDDVLQNLGKNQNSRETYKNFLNQGAQKVAPVTLSTDVSKASEALAPLQSAKTLSASLQKANPRLTSGMAAYNANLVQNSPEFQSILGSLGKGAGSLAAQKAAKETELLTSLQGKSQAAYDQAKKSTSDRAKEIYKQNLKTVTGGAQSARAAEEAKYNAARDKYERDYRYAMEQALGESPDAAQFIESLGIPASMDLSRFQYGGKDADFYTPEQIAELNAYAGVIGETGFDPGASGGMRVFDPGEYAENLKRAQSFQTVSAPKPYTPVNFEPAAQVQAPSVPVAPANAGALYVGDQGGNFSNIQKNIKPLPRSVLQERINPNQLYIGA